MQDVLVSTALKKTILTLCARTLALFYIALHIDPMAVSTNK